MKQKLVALLSVLKATLISVGRLSTLTVTMKQKLVAPLSVLIATLISVGRLSTLTVTILIPGVGNVGLSSIIEYLLGNAGTLDPDMSLHVLFSTVVLWMIVFSIIWFLLSLISRDPKPSIQTTIPQ